MARDVLVWGEICLGRRIKGGRDVLAAGLFEAMFFWALDLWVDICRVREISGARE